MSGFSAVDTVAVTLQAHRALTLGFVDPLAISGLGDLGSW